MGTGSGILALGLLAAAGQAPGQNQMFLREFEVYSNPGGVAVDATGVYTSRLTRQDAPNHIVSLVKHDSTGRELWSRPFITAPIAFAGGVSVAPHGIYAAGTGSRESNAAVDWDIFVARFTNAGALLWTRQISLPGNDFARGIAADDSGVYVIGQRAREGVIRKYDPGGTEMWTRELDAPEDGYHAPLSVATGAAGLYVAGVIQPSAQGITGFLRKYDAGGTLVWDRQLGHIVRALTLDASGVYEVGWSSPPLDGSSGPAENFIRKYSADGGELWTRGLPDGMNPGITADLGVTADFTGIYVAGGTFGRVPGQCSQGGEDGLLVKFDSDGAQQWTRQFGTYEADPVWAVAADSAAVYVAGSRLFAKFGKTSPQSDASRPRITEGCVVNAASYVGGGVAAGEIVTILGTGIGPAQFVAQPGAAAELAQTRVLFNGVAAPLLYVSDTQTNAVVPSSVAGSASVDVQVEFRGARSNVVTAPVVPARPGIFTVDGKQAAALNEDGSLNSPANPANSGSILTLFATGLGATAEMYVYFVISEDEWPVAAEVLSRTAMPDAAPGLLQIKVRLPRGVQAMGRLVVWLAIRSPSGAIGSPPFASEAVTAAVR
jgi:uncharacterized protein (TIGR03437 family)